MPNALRPALRPAVLLTLVATSLGPFGSGQDEPTDKPTGDEPQVAGPCCSGVGPFQL